MALPRNTLIEVSEAVHEAFPSHKGNIFAGESFEALSANTVLEISAEYDETPESCREIGANILSNYAFYRGAQQPTKENLHSIAVGLQFGHDLLELYETGVTV